MHLVTDDITLFNQIAQGDEAAFRTIFAKYTPQLHPFVNDIVKDDEVAKEIIQEVFLRVWLKRDQLPTIEKPASWIYRIASNLSLNHFKRKQLETKIFENITYKQKSEADTTTETLQGRELRNIVDQAISQLTPARQKVFKLIREQGMSRKEVAELLNISENTVKGQLTEALKQIQEFVQRITGIYIPLVVLLYCLPH